MAARSTGRGLVRTWFFFLTLLAAAGPGYASAQTGGPRSGVRRAVRRAEAVAGRAWVGHAIAASRPARRTARALGRLRRPDTESLGRALRSFSDVRIGPEERRKILREAADKPLTDLAYYVLHSIAEVIPEGGFARAGAKADRFLSREANQRIRKFWWGHYMPDKLEHGGRVLDLVAHATHEPRFRQGLDRALDMLRLAGSIEAHNLSRIAVHVPEASRPALRRALADHASLVAREIGTALDGTRRDSGAAHALEGVVEGLVEVAELATAPPDTGRERAFLTATRKVSENLSTLSQAAPEWIQRVAEGRGVEWERLRRRVAVHNRRLERKLESLVRATPGAREAIHEILRDLSVAGRVAFASLRMLGAARNEHMDVETRKAEIKHAAETMGPLFIKLIQTAVNQRGRAQSLARETEASSPTVEALTSLQDQVTPMPMPEVRRQLVDSLGPERAELLLAHMDPTPIASASIAQVHRARVPMRPVPWGKTRMVPVAVKVKRRGLDRGLDDALRASRLAKDVIERVLAMDVSFDPGVRRMLGDALQLVDATVHAFVESFRREGDFPRELREMKRFARVMRTDPHVHVPRPYESYSGDGVITMQLVRGEKLSRYLERYTLAMKARAEEGPTPVANTAEAAIELAILRVRQTHGLEATATHATREGSGYRVHLRMDHPVHTGTEVRVSADGTTEFLDKNVPALTTETAQRIRDHLLTTMLSQMFVHGTMHGDPHDGNFLILPDGRTVSMLDYGQMVRLRSRHFLAPGRFGLALLRRNYRGMAAAIVSMSENRDSLGRAERAKVIETVEEHLKNELPPDSPHGHQEILAALAGAVTESGLALSATYLQWMKTLISWAGNLGKLKDAKVPSSLRSTLLRVPAGSLRDLALKWTPLAYMSGALKNRRVRRLVAEPHTEP